MKVVPKIHTTLATTNHLNALVVPEKVWSNKVQRDKLQAIAADSLDALSTLAANKSLNMAIHYAEMLRAEMKALGDADDLSNDQTTTTSPNPSSPFLKKEDIAPRANLTPQQLHFRRLSKKRKCNKIKFKKMTDSEVFGILDELG